MVDEFDNPIEDVKNASNDIQNPENVATTQDFQVNLSEEETSSDVAQVVFGEVEEQAPHDEFDWDAGNALNPNYSDAEVDEMLNLYDSTFKSINDHEIISGTVASITDSDIVLNIGYKSDGLVARSEFRDMPDIKIGDSVEVYVDEKEDLNGQLKLSRKRAKLLKAWEGIVEAYNEDKILTGTVVSKTKGGLIANVLGLETFLPGSQIDVKPIVDYDSYVGKTMEFKVVKINETIKNAVVSHKALIESDLEEQRQQIIGQLEKGQVLEGVIKNITDFGAFIDLGGVDGLLYITDISWGRVTHPSDVLENGQKLNVVVLDFDDNKKRISLGLKQLQPHPWEVLAENISAGSTVKGKIVNIEDYGAFLEITPGVEGLIHVSEVSWSNQPINSRGFFKLNEMYEAKVVTIDREERKMSLSLKQMSIDPWQTIDQTFPISSKHVGIVRNLTPYGVFVELKDGIGGMVHISDLSWTKRYKHPSEYTRVGEELEVVILEIDKEGRKLSLGHKQIEEDPWDTFETVFPVGSRHEGTVIKKDDRGAIILLPYGVEGYAPKRHLKKENGKMAMEDELLTFQVIDFSRDDKRIMVSNSVIHQKPREDKGGNKKSSENRQKKQRSNADVQNVNKQIEKTTLGDLDVLSQLKKKLEKTEDDAQTVKAVTPPPPPVKEVAKEEAPATEATSEEEE